MIEISRATADDLPQVRRLLGDCGLSSHNVLDPGTTYWVARSDGRLVGVCGLEYCDDAALLRSVAVDTSERGAGLARKLICCALKELRARGIERLFLFSKDTGGVFEKLGFVETLVTEAANALRSAPQVQRYDQIGWRPDERAFGMDLAPHR